MKVWVAKGKAFHPHDFTVNDVNLTRFCHPFSVSAKPPTISENWKDNDELVQKPIVKCQFAMGKLAIMNPRMTPNFVVRSDKSRFSPNFRGFQRLFK
jgi:hypothetical protein